VPYLLDTNVVARRVLASDPLHPIVVTASDTLLRRGEILHITGQNLIEFQALATRPVSANGLGLSGQEATAEARVIEGLFPLLDETPAIYPIWRTMVETHDVAGRQVYDARLVAVMLAHGVTDLLTLNPTHFRRFSAINVTEPQDVR
jgi:predicted nucleic acid-binding protein